MSKLETNTIDTISGSTNLTIGSTNTSSITLGASGDTITIPNGALTGQNYPSFEARLSGNQSVNHNTFTKVQAGDEILDTDTAYDNSSNYRFTPQVAGKYFVYGSVRGFAGGSDPDGVRIIALAFYKNGSQVRDYNGFDSDPNEMRHMEVTAGTIIELNGSSDYLELYGKIYAENT